MAKLETPKLKVEDVIILAFPVCSSAAGNAPFITVMPGSKVQDSHTLQLIETETT